MDGMSNSRTSAAEPFSVCVYCGSRPGARPEYIALARALGTAIGQRGWQLVYGGGRAGLMGQVSQKTFLRGISDIASVASDISGGAGDKAKAYGQRVLSTIVPNLIKGPVRDSDDYMREWCRRDDFFNALPLLLRGEDPDFQAYIRRVAGEERGNLIQSA